MMPSVQHIIFALFTLLATITTSSLSFTTRPSIIRSTAPTGTPTSSMQDCASNSYPRLASSSKTALHAMGPVARAKKMLDPDDYNRIVEQKMEQDGLTRRQAEDEYNQFLENPSFYYALDKKEEYYKSKGYRNIFEGMIGEAEKEGRGDEVRERIENFQRKNKVKAFSVLAVAVGSFLYAREMYLGDPENFLPGI